MRFEEKYSEETYIEFSDRRKQIVLKDAGRAAEYRGLNNNQLDVTAYRIDGGIIKDNSIKKCDFGLYIPSLESIRLIELKGSDINAAVDQITTTYRKLDLTKIAGISRIYGRIVLTKVNTPSIRSTNYVRLKKLLIRSGGDLDHGSKQFKEKLS